MNNEGDISFKDSGSYLIFCDNLIKRQYKDRLFNFIFGSEENREWTLSLYNAVNRSDYTESNSLRSKSMYLLAVRGYSMASLVRQLVELGLPDMAEHTLQKGQISALPGIYTH